MKGYVNALVYLTGEGIKRTSVGVDGDRIVYIGDDCSKITQPYPYKEGEIVLPGFIDEHIHGCNGSDAMDADPEALDNIARSLASEGVTGFLATTMTEKHEKIMKALSVIGAYRKNQAEHGARVLGVHLEGPFISAKYCGAQDPSYIQKPSVEAFKIYQEASGDSIRLVTLAPEEGGEELITYLAASGVCASAGHTDATFEVLDKAKAHGLSSVTHTYNAQRPIHHREVGTVGAAYFMDELYTECICDMIHSSPAAIKLLLKNKPKNKFVLISDAMRAKAMPEGESELGGQKVFIKNGEARLQNGALAGSLLKMNTAIQNLVEHCGVAFTDAVDCATINPATNIGLEAEYGSISVGKHADFAVLDANYSVTQTVRDGKIIFEA